MAGGIISKKPCFSFRWESLTEADPASCPASWRIRSREAGPCEVTILFVPFRVPLGKAATSWAEDCDEVILRRCPLCRQDTIVGHGRRRKQAHDRYHDWIGIRRGYCTNCESTFTFLPVFSLPYTHYSLFARSEALQQRFGEGCSWEKAMPQLKDPERLPDASTVRRWWRGLDMSQLADSFLRRAMGWVAPWLKRGKERDANAGPLPWMVSGLQVLWPLRL